MATINEQPQQQDNPLLKLYDVLHKDELYTKSFDEFKTKYSTDEEIDKLFSVVSENEYYTKDLNSFKGQYFPKQEEVSTQGSENTSVTSQEPLEVSQDISQLGGALLPEGAIVNPDGSSSYFDPSRPYETSLVNVIPDVVVEAPTTKKKSFGSDIYNSLSSGSAKLGADLAGIVEFAYDLASIPQNLIADAIENNAGEGTGDWLRSDFEAVSQGKLNPLRLLTNTRKYYASLSKAHEDEITKFDEGVTESITSGNLGNAGRQIANSIVQSVPSMLGMLATGGTNTTPYIAKTAMNALPFASGALQELDKTGNIKDTYRPIVAGLLGLSEVVMEQEFGTKAILDGIINKKLGLNEVKDFASSYLEQSLKKNGIVSTAIKGGLSEGATQLSQNMINKYSGEKPDQDLMEGVMDAVIIGSVADGALSTVGKLGDISPNKQTKDKINTLQDEVVGLKQDLDNENLSEESKNRIQELIESKVDEINTEVDTVKTELDNLSPKAKIDVENVTKEISELNEIIDPTNEETISETTKQSVEGKIKELENNINEIITNDKENKVGVSSEVGEVQQESIQTQPNESTSQETVATSGVLQTPTQEEISEVVSNTTQLEYIPQETLSKVEDKSYLKQREEELVTSIKDKWSRLGKSNLGVNKKFETYEEFVQGNKDALGLIKDATEYAFIKLAQGSIKTAKQLGESLGITNPNVSKRIFDDAKGKFKTYQESITVPKKQPVKTTINQTTKGGISGTTTVNNRQALIGQIKTLNRGIKEGVKISKEYGQTVNAYVQSLAKNKGLKGVKLPSTVLNTITAKMSSISNDTQLERVLDVVDKIVTDGKFRLKIENVKGLQASTNRAFASKGIPKDLKTSVKEFTKINPLDLGTTENIEKYHELLNKLSKFKQGATKINPSELQRFVDLANSNKEVKDLVKGQKVVTDEAKQAKIDTLNKKLESVGLSQDIIDAVTKGKNLDETIQELQDLYNEEKFTQEQKLRDVAKEYEQTISDNKAEIRESLPTEADRKLFDLFMETNDKNVDFVSKRDLTSYVATLYNTLNNGSIIKLGEFYNKKKVYDNVNNKSLVSKVISNLRVPLASVRKVLLGENDKKMRVASGSVAFQQITKDVQQIGELHSFTGFDNVQSSSVQAQKKIENIKRKSGEILKKYKKDLDDSVSNMVASIYADIIQYRTSWDAEQIETEYNKRLEAWGESLERLKAKKNSTFQKENGVMISNFEKALARITTSKEVDGKTVWEHKYTQQELWNQLPKGQQEYYNFVRETYDSLKDDYFAVSKFYLGLDVEADWKNYVPRTYQTIQTTHEASTNRQLASASGKINDVVGNPFSASVNKETTGAGKSRLISGERLPLDASLNPDIVGTFLNESSAMVYDTLTLGNRQFTGGMLDTDSNGLTKEFKDEVPMTIYNEVVASKILGDRLKIRYSNLPVSGIEYLWGKMGKLGTATALGGWSQYIKQTTPLVEVMARTNPSSVVEAMNTFFQNPDFVMQLMEVADVSLRDLQEYVQPSKTTRKVSTQDMGAIKKMLTKLGVKADDITEFLTDKSLYPLQHMDSFVAKLGWVTFYIDQTKRNNDGIIDLGNIDKDAVSYANTQNSTVMNESDSSLQGNFSKQKWIRYMYPFMSFSINSKISMLTSTQKLIRANGVNRSRYMKEMGGNIGNVLMFNAIGMSIRALAISTGTYIIQGIVNNSGDDEDDKIKILDELLKQSQRNQQLNLVRSTGYAFQDLAYGGLFGTTTEPVFQPVSDFLLESLYGEKYLEEIGFGETKFKKEDIVSEVTRMMGTQGVYIKKFIETVKQGQEVAESDEEYVTRRYGQVNAEKTGVVVDPSRLTEKGLQEDALPNWYKNVQAINLAIATASLSGASDQWMGSARRQSSSIANKLLRKDRGTVSKQSVEDMLKTANNLDNFKIADVTINLTPEQKVQYINDRLEAVKTLKNSSSRGEQSSKRAKMTTEQYEKYISGLADDKVMMSFKRNNRELLKNNKVSTKAMKLEEVNKAKERAEFERKLREKTQK